jgi:hypothetical protein
LNFFWEYCSWCGMFGGCTHHLVILTRFICGSLVYREDKQPSKLWQWEWTECWVKRNVQTTCWWLIVLITLDDLSNSFKGYFSSFTEHGRLQWWTSAVKNAPNYHWWQFPEKKEFYLLWLIYSLMSMPPPSNLSMASPLVIS